jgi:hypothetical protein
MVLQLLVPLVHLMMHLYAHHVILVLLQMVMHVMRMYVHVPMEHQPPLHFVQRMVMKNVAIATGSTILMTKMYANPINVNVPVPMVSPLMTVT